MIHIRPVVSDDAPALLDIYAPYVIETAITFEYEVPTLDDFRQRIKNTLHTHPYLVMERDGEIVGYAYTGQLGSRAAYAWAAETSIYLRRTAVAVVWAPGCTTRWRTPPALRMYRCCTPASPHLFRTATPT